MLSDQQSTALESLLNPAALAGGFIGLSLVETHQPGMVYSLRKLTIL